MTRRRLVWAAFLTTLVASAGSPLAMSLTEALRLARANAPRARAAVALVDAARARQDALRAGNLPVLNAGALGTVGFGGSGSNLGIRGMLASPFVQQWALALEGSWSVLEFARIEPRVDAAREEETAARGELARALREVGLAVVDAFERALAAEAGLQVLDADLEARQRRLAAVQALVLAGATAAVEELQVRAGMARVTASRAALELERDAARAALAVLTGREGAATASLVLDLPPAEGDRPEEAIARARRAQAARLRDATSREALPRLVVAGSAGYANTTHDRAPALWAAGVAVIVPLTAALVERPRQEADARTAEARAEEADGQAQEIALRAAALGATLRGLRAAIDAAAAEVSAAQATLAALEARTQAGAVRELELETARLALAQARVNEVTLRIRADATRARRALLGAR